MRTHSEEEIADVVGDEDPQAHVGEVKMVAHEDEGQRHNVVSNQLPEILPGLLHSQHKDNGLLGPVCRLEKVIALEASL